MIAQELEVSLHMAFVEARQQRHEFITVEHLLLALLDNPSAAEVLRACSANIDDLRKSLANFIKDNTPQVAGTEEVDTQPTLGFQRVIQRAIMHVQSTGNGKKEVTGANVLVAIFGEKDSHAVYYLHQQGVTRLDVRSAQDMHGAVLSKVNEASVFVATAAVADWRVAHVAEQKIKKTAKGDTPDLQFTENPDILGEVAKSARAQSGELFCVGFAAESHDLQKHAQAKREKKGVPLLLGNIGPATFGSDENALLLVDAQGTQEVPQANKLALARKLVAEIAQRMAH